MILLLSITPRTHCRPLIGDPSRFCILGQSYMSKPIHIHNALGCGESIPTVFIVGTNTRPPFASLSVLRHLVYLLYLAKMLPLPIFILLIFSATMLAPSSHVVISLLRIATLQPSVWNTLPASIPSSGFQSLPEEVPELPILVPQAPLHASPTSEPCMPSPIHVAINNAIVPYSFEHTTDDRPTSTAVLLVVLFAMFICLVCFSLCSRIFSLTVGPGIQIVGACQQRVSYRGEVRAAYCTFALLATLPDHVPHFFSFPITGVPSFRPRSLAISGIYQSSHAGSWRDVVPFTPGRYRKFYLRIT